ncbi:50S ribosomal protein L11 [Mycoplasma sp. SG1]|uniref:50S ribosomal protein L11 n=1 Tax=Mycoplasma sp. SG1 TaxID=2810348 RepID=UPI002023FF41|nr:50S ribosomal protein L11 [Mycoplasma sp. SG1]URM52879.1 50S ribosomal protein L11 [Mycoplasma sp. SG1]
MSVKSKTKKIHKVAKVKFLGGTAKPCAVLASLQINMMQFCSQYNEQTKNNPDDYIPAIIYAYKDKTFDFEILTIPTGDLIKKHLKIEKGSSEPSKNIVGELTLEQAKEIAHYKLQSFPNKLDIDAALKSVHGTAKSMGVKIKDYDPSKTIKSDKFYQQFSDSKTNN